MGEAGLEMMLDGPEVLKAHLFSQFDLSQHLVENFKFPLRVLNRVGNLDLVKYGKIHRGILRPLKVTARSGRRAGRRRPVTPYTIARMNLNGIAAESTRPVDRVERTS